MLTSDWETVTFDLEHARELLADSSVPDGFELTATALFSKDPEHEKTWRIDMVPWSERNTEAFAGLDVTVVKGEAEQLLWKLDDVLARPGATVQLGVIEDLDSLPLPDACCPMPAA